MRADTIVTEPAVPLSMYRDGFGNWCTRLIAPPGGFRVTSDALIKDSGLAEPSFPYASEHSIDSLPEEALVFLAAEPLLRNRTLVGDGLENCSAAWRPAGAGFRPYAIRAWHVAFDYQAARPTKTAWETFHERRGVCRDYAHLALTLCRCLNIPARYCTGYLGDIGVAGRGRTHGLCGLVRGLCGRRPGGYSIRATISGASAAYSSRAAAMPPMWPSA